MKTQKLTQMGLLLALAGGACATVAPPSELVTARASYNRIQQGGMTAKFDPADLDTARKAMQAAEHSFEEDGDTQHTRDLAYAADRRALIAEARASARSSTKDQQETIREMHSETSAQLGRANQKLALQGQQLSTEREARAAADKRAEQAAADLAKVASVKQESRGMVITLSGGVLFASGKSDLLAAAQVKLNSVADALTQQDPDAKMVVEGHTDSQGRVAYNQDLSQRRAEAVRDYLVSRGIASDRITSQGFGAARSIADNKSAEGRANNRRVEIVVTPHVSAP